MACNWISASVDATSSRQCGQRGGSHGPAPS